MNNFDYHTNFRTAPKRRARAYSIKLWLKNLIYSVAVISSCVFLFGVFTSNSTQENKITISQSPVTKLDESIEITTQKTQNKIKVIDEVDQVSSKNMTVAKTRESEQILPDKTTPMTSVIKASASLKSYSAKLSTDNTLRKSGRNNTVKKVEEISLTANKKQNSQIDRIVKQIASDEKMVPRTLAKTPIHSRSNSVSQRRTPRD